MDNNSKSLISEGHGKTRLVQHSHHNAFSQDLIGTFYNTIMLWAVPDSVLILNATLGNDLEHGIAHIFDFLLIPQYHLPSV